MLTDHSITIPEEEWEDCGDGRLLTTLAINGSKLHIEAIEVKVTKGGVQKHAGRILNDYFDRLSDVFGQDGHFYTTIINGKEYAIFASPFCQ